MAECRIVDLSMAGQSQSKPQIVLPLGKLMVKQQLRQIIMVILDAVTPYLAVHPSLLFLEVSRAAQWAGERSLLQRFPRSGLPPICASIAEQDPARGLRFMCLSES